MAYESDRDFQLNFLFQTAAEGILLADADGVLTRINPAAAAMLDLQRDEALGQRAADLFRRNPALKHLFFQPGEQETDIPLPHKRIAAGVGADRPNGTGRIVLLHDVTEQTDIDSRRAALVRSIAHDLRNPLNALSGYADLVGKFGDLNPDQARFLGRVTQTVDKLYDLADSLVDLAWIEAGMALEHRPIELAHLIHDAADELADDARVQGVTLVISTQDPIPTLMGDPQRIKQMIRALLENGVRSRWATRASASARTTCRISGTGCGARTTSVCGPCPAAGSGCASSR
jgi:signal transduction histidine kinase